MVSWTMRLRNTDQSYGWLAQGLHWLVAVLIFAQLGLGLYAAGLPLGIAKLQWLTRHKSLGVALLALVLARLVWRFASPPPALPDAMSRLERAAAVAAHRVLYALLILAPVAGWLYASAAGLSVNWFGLFQLPDLVAKNAGQAALFKSLHQVSVALLALLIAGHVGAALRHAFVLRDGLMRRMLPWKRPPA
jgi:cytochrome b561